jgi:CBS domain-containing protein
MLALTASDIMTCGVVTLPAELPLRDAARVLIQNHISGAPVVDARRRCVGVLSAMDFVRQVGRRDEMTPRHPATLPATCGFQAKHNGLDRKEITTCTLPPGVCSIQVKHVGPQGKDVVVCSEPHSVLADWQMVEVEKLPTDAVSHYMTADPVTVPTDTSIITLARMMIDAHIHRVIVVDEEDRPIGIVSSIDILAALARMEEPE